MNSNLPVIKRGEHNESLSEESKPQSKEKPESAVEPKDMPTQSVSAATSTQRVSQKKRLIPLNKVVTHLQSKPFLTTYWR